MFQRVYMCSVAFRVLTILVYVSSLLLVLFAYAYREPAFVANKYKTIGIPLICLVSAGTMTAFQIASECSTTFTTTGAAVVAIAFCISCVRVCSAFVPWVCTVVESDSDRSKTCDLRTARHVCMPWICAVVDTDTDLPA